MAVVFPQRGKKLSMAWKIPEKFFHGVENSGEHFSMAWKTVNHRTAPLVIRCGKVNIYGPDPRPFIGGGAPGCGR
jgi:hypothetical protein